MIGTREGGFPRSLTSLTHLFLRTITAINKLSYNGISQQKVIMKSEFIRAKRVVLLALTFLFINVRYSSSQTFCTGSDSNQISGIKDGYRYELWNQHSLGTACMTIGNEMLFSGKWICVENYLARRGLAYDQTRKHDEIGDFFAEYKCNYKPSDSSGNSYLAVYGWTVDPLIEYYIVEDWCRWNPSMAANSVLKGSININESVYDIYETTRENQPSIIGDTNFKQYFSIRRYKRDSGKINISDHFKKWESLGMNLGKMHEVSFVVEGYKSSGYFNFSDLTIKTVNYLPGKSNNK